MECELKRIGPWSYFAFPEVEKAGVLHGFMTRASETLLDHADERDAFIAALSATGMTMLTQQHGDVVHVLGRGEKPRAGDGLVLSQPGVVGVIKTADCLPVILYAKHEPLCAIVHAGWRGTALAIVVKAARAMVAAGARPDDLGALIGPGIGPCCYHVGEDVVAAFRAAGFGASVFEERAERTFLDLKKANRELLAREGIDEVSDAGLCTSCRGDLFFSARRGAGRGRQVNFALLAG